MFTKIPGFDYQIDEKGNVRNSVKYVLKGYKTPPGNYLKVKLTKNGKRKDYTIHDLMMMTFDKDYKKNKKQFIIHHRDHNTRNNKLKNLQWRTQKDNIRLYNAAKRKGEL